MHWLSSGVFVRTPYPAQHRESPSDSWALHPFQAESMGQERKRRRTTKTRPLAEHPGVQLEKNTGQGNKGMQSPSANVQLNTFFMP